MDGPALLILSAAPPASDARAHVSGASSDAGTIAENEQPTPAGLGQIAGSMPDETALIRAPKAADPGPRTDPRPDATKRIPRKIRYTAVEWAAIVERARACGRAPARYVREVSLGATPKTKQGRRRGADAGRLLAQLARVGNSLTQLARVANATGQLPSEAVLRHAVDELLAVVRRVD